MREVLTESALVLLNTVLGLVVALGVPALIKWMRARGVTVSAQQEKRLLELAPIAAAGVEEYGRAAARSGMRLQSNEKLDQAARMLREMAMDGLKGVTEAKVRLAIEASLPKMRKDIGQTAEMAVFRVSGPPGPG